MSFPRILLITPAASDGKYAGGEVLRKTVKALPGGCVWWCGLKKKGNGVIENVVEERSFPYPDLHWRFRQNSWALLFKALIGARSRAKQIAVWAKSFQPDVLWVLAEEEGVNVGYYLHKMLKIPMHLTFHDVPELFARQFAMYPGMYASFYLSRVINLVRSASSYDAISSELADYIWQCAGPPDACKKLVYFPSVSTECQQTAECYHADQPLRRIGLCGSLRVSEKQWASFLDLLAALPFKFELVVFSDPHYLPKVSLPANVVVDMNEYQKAERDLVRQFTGKKVHACYLGLWKDADKRLFCRTSLSSKLATYTAVGVPVIVDGPEDSVAWTLVRKYSAGVLIRENVFRSETGKYDCTIESRKTLMKLFADESRWRQFAHGSSELCIQELNMEKNIQTFEEVLLNDR